MKKRWTSMPPRRRIILLALAVGLCGVLATLSLLRQDGVREVLYKTF